MATAYKDLSKANFGLFKNNFVDSKEVFVHTVKFSNTDKNFSVEYKQKNTENKEKSTEGKKDFSNVEAGLKLGYKCNNCKYNPSFNYEVNQKNLLKVGATVTPDFEDLAARLTAGLSFQRNGKAEDDGVQVSGTVAHEKVTAGVNGLFLRSGDNSFRVSGDVAVKVHDYVNLGVSGSTQPLKDILDYNNVGVRVAFSKDSSLQVGLYYDGKNNRSDNKVEHTCGLTVFSKARDHVNVGAKAEWKNECAKKDSKDKTKCAKQTLPTLTFGFEFSNPSLGGVAKVAVGTDKVVNLAYNTKLSDALDLTVATKLDGSIDNRRCTANFTFNL